MWPPALRALCRPNSYSELVNDAVDAVLAAVADGVNRLEVEFPAVSEVDGRWQPAVSFPFLPHPH